MADLEVILDGLQSRLGALAGHPVALEGGITNRNYRVRFGDRDYVLRLPGKDTSLLGISRDAERIATETASRLGLAPALAVADEAWLVTAYVACAPVDADELRRAPESVGRALRAFHDSGVRLPASFWVPDLLEEYARIVGERGGSLPEDYAPTESLAARIAAVMPLVDPVPCHDDLLPGNLIRADTGSIMLIDWEYAGMGHRMFDLGNLAVNNEFDEGAEDRLLAAYFDAPPSAAHRAGLKLMRLMSDAREAAWGVVQGVLSELDFDFSGYAAHHFARLAQAARDPRLEEWLGAAAA